MGCPGTGPRSHSFEGRGWRSGVFSKAPQHQGGAQTSFSAVRAPPTRLPRWATGSSREARVPEAGPPLRLRDAGRGACARARTGTSGGLAARARSRPDATRLSGQPGRGGMRTRLSRLPLLVNSLLLPEAPRKLLRSCSLLSFGSFASDWTEPVSCPRRTCDTPTAGRLGATRCRRRRL